MTLKLHNSIPKDPYTKQLCSSIVRLVGIRLLVMHQKWISTIEEIISDKKLVL